MGGGGGPWGGLAKKKRKGQVVGSSGHGDESLGSINERNILNS